MYRATMSGGKLVHMDRAGRDVKHYPLAEGLATLGSDPACDIRILLPTVSPHHATVVVHANQTVVQARSARAARATLLNGAPVGVAALRHGDVLTVGGRALRWEYDRPAPRPPPSTSTAAPAGAARRERRARPAARRGSEPPARLAPAPAHRASMPAASSGGKQVAIVQPQRRDNKMSATPSQSPNNLRRSEQSGGGGGGGAQSTDTADGHGDRARRSPRGAPADLANLSDTTKATLWIESRKSSPRKSAKPQTPTESPPKTQARTASKSPRNLSSKSPAKTPSRQNVKRAVSAKKSTPLRMTVLRKVQSAQRVRVTKIQAPLKMDSTKQAAIMLMTRHTPKSKQASPRQESKRPSYVAKKPSPLNRLSRKWSGAQHTPKATPKRTSNYSQRISGRYASVINITDSETQSSLRDSSATRRSDGKSSLLSPFLPSPKKSALKNSSGNKNNRKTESIKFDLSNLDNVTHNRSSDDMMVNEMDDNSLRYSDSSLSRSDVSTMENGSIECPLSIKSTRASAVEKNTSLKSLVDHTYSRRSTKSVNDQSWRTTVASARNTMSPRLSRDNLESYSIVDLVSMDSNDSSSSRPGSRYTSAGSVNSYSTYESPTLKSSTPYSRKRQVPENHKRDSLTRGGRSTSLPKLRNHKSGATAESVTTPENSEDTTKNITFNSTRISRASKSRSRINNSDVLLGEEGKDASPKSSKRISKAKGSPLGTENKSINGLSSDSLSTEVGNHTPESRRSPAEVSTPVLNFQSLLDASQQLNKTNDDMKSRRSKLKRKTIGVLRRETKRGRIDVQSQSLSLGRSLKGRDISANFGGSEDSSLEDEEVVTPKSAAKPVQEGVKNKHSTAKKTQSKRSLIDHLNESDIVKQLFNSPVKRKLSQSMTEFSRKRLFEEDEELPTRPTRATIAVAARTPDYTAMNDTEVFSPEVFVSPLNTPNDSPNITGIKRLFQKSTPNNDLRNVRGVKEILRTPRPRRSIKNDLTQVSGVKRIFANSPRNRLSNVRVKQVFAVSPKNDLRRVSGVKALFQSQKKKERSPRNELNDFSGIKSLFKENNPSRRKSPKNDLSDVSGVKRLFRQEKLQSGLDDVSGIEQLFQESGNHNSSFDRLMGRPPIRATYSKAKSFSVNVEKRGRVTKSKSKSLYNSITHITDNVQQWLETELKNRVGKDTTTQSLDSKKMQNSSTSKKSRSTTNVSKNVSKINLVRELQKLNTSTVDGSIPVIVSRTRNSSILKNELSELASRKKSASELYGAHTLPIKKRSVVETSVNKTNNERSHKLPIKKRAVAHSTPVKGRVSITINASEISRMSPISTVDKTVRTDAVIRSSPQNQTFTRNKVPAGKKKSAATGEKHEKSPVAVKSLPRQTRSRKAAQRSPTVAKTLRKRISKNEQKDIANVKKRRTSIVIVKKVPTLSPKPAPPKSSGPVPTTSKVTRKGKAKRELQETVKVTPRKTRSTKAQTSQSRAKITTPKKNTRAKARQTSLIISKPSPKLKQRATRQAKINIENSVNELQLPAKQKRKVANDVKEDIRNDRSTSQAKQEPATKTRKSNTNTKSKGKVNTNKRSYNNTDQFESIVQTRKMRQTVANGSAVNLKTGRSESAQKKSQKITESKKTVEPKGARQRGKKLELQPAAPSGRTKRGRGTTADDRAAPPAAGGDTSAPIRGGSRRGVKQKEASPPAVKRGRTAAERPAPDVSGRARKRRGDESQDAVTPRGGAAKKRTRTRNTSAAGDAERAQKTSVDKKELKKPANKKAVNEKSPAKSTRGAGEEPTSSAGPRDARGKRTTRSTASEKKKNQGEGSKRDGAQRENTVAGNPPQRGGRKKRTNVELPDAKESARAPKRAKRAVVRPTARVAPQVRAGTQHSR